MDTKRFRKEFSLHLMVWPSLIIVLIYAYVPMMGLVIAFEKFLPAKGVFGSDWVGFDNFQYMFSLPAFKQVVFNTVNIAFWKIVFGLAVPIIFSLLLNEVTKRSFQRIVQTMIYLPHFLSWVLLAGILTDMLSTRSGIVNELIKAIGFEPVFFLGDNRWFPGTMIVSDVWKNFGFSTIIYLAALTNIDPTYYESAVIDGAGKWKQAIHITLPLMRPIIILMLTLSLGNLLNAGFDQIFNLYNPIVYESGDILDTMIYRIGLVDAKYGLATAVGLIKSLVSFILISVSYFLSYRFAGYRIF